MLGLRRHDLALNKLVMEKTQVKIEFRSGEPAARLLVTAPPDSDADRRLAEHLAVLGVRAASAYAVRTPLRLIIHANLLNRTGNPIDQRDGAQLLETLRKRLITSRQTQSSGLFHQGRDLGFEPVVSRLRSA